MITRRVFLGGVAALGAPLWAGAQATRALFRIGVLAPAHPSRAPSVQGMKTGLADLGLREGRNTAFEVILAAGGASQFSAAAAVLVNANVALIFAVQDGCARAARAATQSIPVVFTDVGDPVAAGIVHGVDHPGGNLTGVSSSTTELVPDRLGALTRVVPDLARVWAVYDADDGSSVAAVERSKQAVKALGLELLDRPVRSAEEVATALKTMRRDPREGFLAPPSMHFDIPARLADLSRRVPGVFTSAFWADAGGLVSYGADPAAEGRQAAHLIAKIFQGGRPQDMPVQAAGKAELVVNLKTARQLGVSVPDAIRSRADRLIPE